MAAYDDIILGEGVAIDSGAAPVTMRIGSGLIDIIVYGLIFVGLTILVGNVFVNFDGGLGTAITISVLVLSLVVLPATVETLTRGLSLGRLAVGLRVVRDDGGPVTARHAFIRSLLGFFEIFASAGIVAISIAVVNDRGKRLGDIIAGTYSMRTRGGRSALPPIVMPPALATWSATADVARLPDGLALTARLFLGRVASMDVAARARLAHSIARSLGRYVSPPPPEGTHPETFIAAVIATRRDRDYAAALRLEALNARESTRMATLPFGIPDAET